MQKKVNYDKSKFITKQEAADIIDVCPQTIANFIERGVLSGYKSANHIFVSRESVEKFMRDAQQMISAKKELDAKQHEYEQKKKEYDELIEKLTEDTVLASAAYQSKFAIMETLCEMCGSDEFVPDSKYSRRVAEVMTLWISGQDYTTIAGVYGLTRERIRQLVMVGIRHLPKWKNYVQIHKDFNALTEKYHKLETENQMLQDTIVDLKLKVGDSEDNVCSDPLMSKNICDLGFSNRTVNCLTYADIRTVYDLTRKTRDDLLGIRNMGKKSVLEIQEFLDKNKLSLKK
jgi:DNA-directed RNA polymerase alpha subunit